MDKNDEMIMWPDWKKRQTELIDKAEYYDFRVRPSMAEWIRYLGEKVPTPTSRKMLSKYLDELAAAWMRDFAGSDQLRRDRLNTISRIVLRSMASEKMRQDVVTVGAIMKQLGDNLENLTPLSIAFAPHVKAGNKMMHFYEMCYHYPLFVEGVYDEAVRLLFFLLSSLKEESIPLEKVNKMDLWKLRDGFRRLGEPPDLFFQGWEPRIRNSIAHARFRYDGKSGMMRFVDIDPKGNQPVYDAWFTIDRFMLLGRQLLDIYEIFQDVLFVSRINQLMLVDEVPNLAKDLLMPRLKEGLKEGILKDRIP